MRQPLYRHLLLLLLALLSAHGAWSQGATTSAMNGVITDKAGSGLPGATVIAIHTPTNTQYVAPTNSEGRFNIQNMRVGGPYTVRVTFVGYKDAERTGIFLTLAQNLRLDLNLSEATTELAGVTISGRQDPVINAGRTGAATSVQREQIERLPTLNRSFDDFTRLTPQSNGQSFGGRNSGFNNIPIDGALFNNAFGLSATVGGQANAQPISLDAIDQIQVSLAPYDVRQGSFTGAGINAVTRSGTNKVSGSIYGFYRNQDLVGSKVGDVTSDYPKFNLKNYGFRVGGPIIKDKLFFFLNAEQERRNDPPTGNYTALKPGQTAGGNISQASSTDLDALSQFLSSKYGYNTGPYEGYQLKSNSDKATAKLDWNISAAHRLSVKYNYLKSYRDVPPSSSGLSLAGARAQSNTSLPYLAAYYRINNNLNSVIAELNSTFGSRASNNFTAGVSSFRDFRESSGGIFPLVDIGNGQGSLLTTFGYEAFSANNILNSDVYQIGDNYTMYLGKHNVTLGTYTEFYKFKNGFAPNYYGLYSFNSLADFYSNANQTPNPATGTISNPTNYRLQYSALADGSFPFANIKAQQYGVYAQDEYTPVPNLKVTVGVRADVPNVPTKIARNEAAAQLTFRDGYKIETDKFQSTSVLFSPRIGFNWDVQNDQKTQVRGGTGIFTGRVPYVWISNQASNNGVLFGSFSSTNGAAYPFSPDVTANIPASRTAATTYNLAVTDKDFKFPQVWRTNLAVDKQLPLGIVGTLEGIFTQDLNAVYHDNVNLPTAAVTAQGADKRPIYYATDASGNVRNTRAGSTPRNAAGVQTGNYVPAVFANNRIYGPLVDQYGTELLGAPGANGFIQGGQANTVARPNITDAIVMRNTNKGYSYSLTAQLRRSFSNGFYVDAAYTYTDSRSVNDGGSIAQSIWRDRAVSGDPNANVLSYSNFLQQHRVILSASYKKEYLGHLGTTVSMFYVGAAANDAFNSSRFSYVYSGDMNGDGAGGNNDLIYVPRDQSEVVLNTINFYSPNDTKRTAAGIVSTYTADQQWADLDAYIKQDKYLSERRGQYAERNGAVRPWQHRIDFRLLQDVFTDLGTNKNSIQLSVDIFNIGNLLNKNWGIVQTPNRNALLTFQNYNATSNPTFTFPYLTAPVISAATLDASGNVVQKGTVTTPGQVLSKTFRDDVGNLSARWQMQVGVRYIFN
ncbi:TonB-dependent receptor [Hymenobacter persicinus]|uniref:TonB-dependent receptor n=1 Tax=Hymenobacter persicinus TaxID=2025506 RepID=A0A4Q5L7C3_9BACT|nr:TonB-dependent receptor [Hymenobacter persicinus]RYU76058.1 TonB-dependent receptor [Hymenobacter persicinus]